MHRIDGAGATPANEFTRGNPATGIAATVVTDDWLNAVQRELVAVIETAGLGLNKPDNTQLYQAIQIMIAAATQSSGFSTGDGKITLKNVADPGWILLNDGTIGPSGSGATTRANDDVEALYKLLWANVTNTWAPVAGGRGISADADWGAAKLMSFPKALGRALAVAGAGEGLTPRSLGQALGQEEVLLTGAESGVAPHPHLVFANENGGAVAASLTNTNRPLRQTVVPGSEYNIGGTNTDATVGLSADAEADDAEEAHDNMSPVGFWNVMVKL